MQLNSHLLISNLLSVRNAILLVLTLVLTTVLYANDYNYWGEKNIHQPDNYIFGYGSLVNAESRAASFESMTSVVAARISADFGYKRVWNYQGPGFTALGLEKTNNAMSINGIIYSVKAEDMTVWDQRERNYDRIELPWEFVESVDWMDLPKKGKLWVYVPKVNNTASPSHPIIQSYVDICVTGFLDYSEEFAIEFLETTGNWSMYWLNDRLVARRPWVHFKKHSRVDNLLDNHPKENNLYHFRAFPSFPSEWHRTESLPTSPTPPLS